MPPDPTQIAAKVADGLSPICAHCDHYWEGRSRGLPGDTCTATDGCAGPLRGDCFHEYKGPLTDFTRLCFVCGKPPQHGLRVKVSGTPLLRAIGICDAHIGMVRSEIELRFKSGLAPLRIDGVPVTPPRKKTVWEAVAEADTYFDEQDRKKYGGL